MQSATASSLKVEDKYESIKSILVNIQTYSKRPIEKTRNVDGISTIQVHLYCKTIWTKSNILNNF